VRFSVVHVGRDWPRVQNHMDVRECPTCCAAVPRNRQQRHALYHQEVDEMLAELAKRTGITEESVEVPARWTAVVEASYEAVEGPDVG